MDPNDVNGQVVDAAMKVHSALGPGLLESTYQTCLLFELHRRGLRAEREVELPVVYDGVRIDCGYRIDLLVEDLVIVEIKAVDSLAAIHQAQLLTYLKLSSRKLGLLHELQCPAPERRHQAAGQRSMIRRSFFRCVPRRPPRLSFRVGVIPVRLRSCPARFS